MLSGNVFHVVVEVVRVTLPCWLSEVNCMPVRVNRAYSHMAQSIQLAIKQCNGQTASRSGDAAL